MRRQLLSVLLVVALLSGSLTPALTQPGPEQIGDRPGVEVVATAEAQSNAGTLAKQLSAFVTVPVIGGWYPWDTVNTTETDANQTKIDIYKSGQNSKSNFEVYNASMNNYLEDSMSIALLEGKNAYIRALNNQSSEAAALTAAKEAQDEYYSVKEYNLVQRWNNQVSNVEYMRSKAINESGIQATEGFTHNRLVHVHKNQSVYSDTLPNKKPMVNVTRYGTTTITLQNGTNVEARTIEVNLRTYNTAQGYWYDPVTVEIGPKTGEKWYSDRSSKTGDRVQLDSVMITPPTEDYDPVDALVFEAYKSKFSKIDSQTSKAHNEVENFVNNTYTKYQTGEINNSDLFDPYLAQRDYSPVGSFQSWATMSLTLMGANSPENVENVGHFRVTVGGAVYEGMLLSDESPASGKFEAGTMYDPTKIGGQQYVVTDSNLIELKSNFTVQNITNSDGEDVQNVTVHEVDYNTVNTTEYNELMEELQLLRAEVEAREQQQQSTSGAGWLPNFGDGFGFGKGLLAGGAAGIVVAILGVLAILALLWPLLGPALIS